MNRFSTGVPACPRCNSTETTVAPSQAHYYLCMNCGNMFTVRDRWDEDPG